MISKDIIAKKGDKLIKDMEYLRDAWDTYHSEPFMAGKVESADLMIFHVKKTFEELLGECNV